MLDTMLHIWRNTPVGRETLLQSVYFSERLGDFKLHIYRPVHKQALMYFDAATVTLELDSSYLASPETAEKHLHELLDATGVSWQTVDPTGYTASTLPNLPTSFSVMTCPRAISEDLSRVGLGHIGPKVRTLVKSASFPVFIAAACVRPWHRIAAFFGGSELGLRAVRIAKVVASRAQMPLTVYTQIEGPEEAQYRAKLTPLGIDTENPDANPGWVPFTSGTFEKNLYEVHTDALVVAGAAGESLMRTLIFGSKLETIQRVIPNPLLVIGPNCRMLS